MHKLLKQWLLRLLIISHCLLLPTVVQAFDWKKLNPFYEAPKPIRDPHWFSSHFTMPQTDQDLVKLIKTQSFLFTQTKEPVIGGLGLINLVQDDFANMIGILYSRAYYGGKVEITIDGIPLEEISSRHTFPDSSAEQKIPVRIRITPGERFVFDQLAIRSGDLTMNPQLFGLQTGEFANSDVVFQAEEAIVSNLRANSFALATITDRTVAADHATKKLDVSIITDAGKPALFGFTTVSGTDRMDSEFTRYMFDVPTGKPYRPATLEKGAARLRNLGVFESVVVEEAKALTDDNQLPITLSVTERKPRVFGLGAEYSNTDGTALQAYWKHRNLFGHAEQLKVEGKVSRLGQAKDWRSIDYQAAVTFQRPGTISPDTLYQAGLSAERLTTEQTVSRAYKAQQQLSRQLDPHRTIQLGTQVEFTTDETNGLVNRYFIASMPGEIRFDYRDNPLDTRQGWFARAAIEPGYELRAEEPFVKIDGEAAYYWPVDEEQSWVIAARASMGSYITGGQSLPRNRRFFAGGGGSVRGYGYQRIGPEDSNDTPIGGLSRFESSLELRKQITENIQLVPFVDVGAVGAGRVPAFGELYYGAGLGIRYATPIGPLRLDVAMPINPDANDKKFSIYAGIGQAF